MEGAESTMGASAAKKRAAARSAKKRKSASPAITAQTSARNTPAPVAQDEKQGSIATTEVMEQPGPALGQAVLPERQARGRHGYSNTMLSQIVEEPEYGDADRTIGNREVPDEKWHNWKAGPVECEDEFESEDDISDESDSESDSESGETKSIRSASRKKATRPLTKARSRQASSTSKSKPRGSKRRQRDLSESESDNDGGSEPQRKRPTLTPRRTMSADQ
jgi:hypothetical protein